MSDSQKPIGYWRSMSPKYNDLNAKLRGLPSALMAASPDEPASYGAAGLLPALPALATPALGAAGAVAGSAAFPLAAAYGIGKLVAPEATDRAVGKLKDLWTSRIAPVIKRAQGVGSGYETGMLSSIPGSGLIEKALPEGAKKLITAVKAQNPGAVTAGKIAGNVGQMAIPGMNLVKGATVLGKLGAGAANAAINAAPYALGVGANEFAESGDIGKAIKAGAMNLGAGTALGGVAGGVSQLLGPRLQKILQNANIRAAGISPKAFKTAVRSSTVPFGGGAHAQRIKGGSLRKQLSDYITENAAYGEPAQEKLLDALHDKWNAIGQAWDKPGTKVQDLLNKVLADETVQRGVSAINNGEDALMDLLGNANKQKDFGSVRGFLMDKIKLGARSGDEAVAAKGVMARGIRDIIDNHVMELSPDLEEAKRLYAITRPIENAVAAKESGLGSPLIHKGSSDTFMRLAASAIFGGSGAALGGPVGALAGNALGQALNSLVSGGISKAGGMAAGKIDKLLSRTGGKINLGKLPSVAPGMLANAIQTSPAEPSPDSVSTVPIPEPAHPKVIGAATGTPEAIQQKEGSLDEGAVDEARGKTLAGYEQRIQDIIESEYKTNLEPYGVEYQDFLKGVMAIIGDGKGGIDPKRAAPALFPDKDQRTKFLRDYDKALALQGINVGSALEYGTGIGQGGLAQAVSESTGSQGAMQSKKSYEDLIGLLSNLAPTVDKSSDKQRDAQVRQDIATIKKMAGGAEQKKAMIEELIQNRYGVDLAQLKGLGLYA